MPERATRQRNVTSRDRTGCVTCRARRVKCDEARPDCNNCRRLSLPCEGYAQRIVFKDQSSLVRRTQRQRQRQLSRVQSPQSEPRSEHEASIESVISTESPGSSPAFLDATTLVDGPTAARAPAEAFTLQDKVASFSPPHLGTREPSFPLMSANDNQLHEPTRPHSSPAVESVIGFEGNEQHQKSTTNSSPDGSHPNSYSRSAKVQHAVRVPPIVPPGLLESYKFPEDVIYYHRLTDSSPYGLLTVLGLSEIVDVPYLDGSFFHAAFALSSLEISRSDVPPPVRNKAALHSLDHFVEALGSVGRTLVDGDQHARLSKPSKAMDADNREKAISWLSTVLFLALFELQRGEMKLWYIHSCAAVEFLSQYLSLVVEMDIGESLIRSFSRIAALLDIYDRTHSVQNRLTGPEVSLSLLKSLTVSPMPYDRLLHILPRVNELEENWRADPRPDLQWDARIESLRQELKQWRESLEPQDVPLFDDDEVVLPCSDSPSFEIKPFTLQQSREPVRAATSMMHYISSLVRLDLVYPPGPKRMLTDSEIEASVHHVCRLAAGVSYELCALVNGYGHGMLPVLMNMYWATDDDRVQRWIRDWIASFPRDREGIWDVRQMHKLLAHLEKEYGRNGPRAGWSIIKCRMIDLEVEGQGGSERFSIEIYARGKRGWSIDFVEIE